MLEEIACEFAKWMINEGYEDNWKDVDNDGKTWSNINDELALYDKGKTPNRTNVERCKIEDLLNDFLINNDYK